MISRQSDLSRDRILSAVRAKEQRTVAISTVYVKEDVYRTPDHLLDVFKEELETVAGRCIVCDTEDELFTQLSAMVKEREFPYLYSYDKVIADKLSNYGVFCSDREEDFLSMPAAVTPCEVLVARTGSVVLSSRPDTGRQLYAYPPVHFVVANEDQLVAYPEDALALLQVRYAEGLPSTVSFVTGPSRTADIEKTLVLGAHGPKELIIFVLKNKAY